MATRTVHDITLDHLDAGCRAAIAARDGSPIDGYGYDQASWCGTACCIWGHTVLVAGLPLLAAEGGPPDGWHPSIARMLHCCSTTPEQVLSRSLYWGDVSRIRGDVSRITGDASRIRGDVSGMRGYVSGIRGDVSGIWGYVSGIRGDVSGITGDVSPNTNLGRRLRARE